MRASIKLKITEKATNDGYPIYLYLRKGAREKKKVIGRSFDEFWDADNGICLKTHPYYHVLAPKIMEIKGRIFNVNFGSYAYEDAVCYLFDEIKEKHIGFYDAAQLLCDDSSTGKLYKTVINSFNSMFPKVTIDGIDASHAEIYMRWLLKKNRPNGVHVYMRTLNAMFNKVSNLPNPFKGVRPARERTKKRNLTDEDLRKLFTTLHIRHKFDGRNTKETINNYRYYYMLLFYLGGIDVVDLKHLRYDKHVFDGRVQFTRQKGGTSAFINNKILPEAEFLLSKFDCYPYLVPIYKATNYHQFVNNMNDRFYGFCSDLELSKKPTTKTARHTFINRGQQLQLDERIVMEIVGHERQGVHSIYTDHFTLAVRDAAHEKIVNLTGISLFF